MTLYRVIDPFASDAAGVVNDDPDFVYDETHPLVKQFPSKFREVVVLSAKPEMRVEQATAAPGEKRAKS